MAVGCAQQPSPEYTSLGLNNNIEKKINWKTKMKELCKL